MHALHPQLWHCCVAHWSSKRDQSSVASNADNFFSCLVLRESCSNITWATASPGSSSSHSLASSSAISSSQSETKTLLRPILWNNNQPCALSRRPRTNDVSNSHVFSHPRPTDQREQLHAGFLCSLCRSLRMAAGLARLGPAPFHLAGVLLLL